MKHAQRFSIRGFEPIAENALVKPDHLEQLLGRGGILVKRWNPTVLQAPLRVKVFRNRGHLVIAFPPPLSQSQEYL
jgi:hypothetical protein